ncbi:unnamed protein product [Oppiella nova]|uniref:Uncharacterized protein n=1 Tax=Oppiella nova TaxID=334625 RepID=A0A7R9LQP8_9ACAR|nr:unnamed protein product [Oppiella nova]CAG2165977.1 unnamed protein product [Oppiella nova]
MSMAWDPYYWLYRNRTCNGNEFKSLTSELGSNVFMPSIHFHSDTVPDLDDLLNSQSLTVLRRYLSEPYGTCSYYDYSSGSGQPFGAISHTNFE